jgi:TonB-dependent receptor
MRLQNIALFTLAFFSFLLAEAQMGTIRGVVIDDGSGETLIGVNVVVSGTTTGASTDLDGAFSIKVPAGTYSIDCSYISYAKLTISDIVVKEGEVTTVGELRLKPDAIQSETVVITARRSRNNETAMVTMQKKSANVMDGISSQTFKKVGDSDAGAAIKRVTGVSVQGGKYVYVRGLGDRYTKTTLNGMEIPGLDPDRNSIQLDLFPTSLIDNISVFKSFSPDLAGDFTGGVVDIITKDFPDEKQTSVSASLAYNPSMNLNSNFLTYESSNADYMALGAKSRDIPFNRSLNLQQDGYRTNPELISSATRKFDPVMGAMRSSSFLNTGFGINTGNQINKDSYTIGYNFAVNYSRSFKFYEDILYSEYITNADRSKNQLLLARRDSGDVGIEEVFWSAFGSGSIKKGNSSLSVGLMRLQNGTKQASLLDGSKSSLGSDQSAQLLKHILYYNERSITNLLLSAKHYIPEKDIEITFKSAPTLAQNKEPDFRQTVYNIEDDKVYISGGGLPIVQRLYRDLEEWSFGNRLDVKWNFKQWAGEKSTLKAGAAYTYKQREFNLLTYKFREIARRDDYTLNPEEILEPSNIFDQNTNPNGVVVSGFEQPSNNYEANSTNLAFYIQNELPLSSVLKVIYGVRLEQFSINYTGRKQVVRTSADVYDNDEVLSELNILPSFGAIYNLAEDMNLRFNFSQTVARPSFKEKSGAEIVDALTGRVFIGNLDLEQTEISNFDLRLERFFEGGQLVSISGFYKQFSNPIEIVAYDQASTEQFTPRNSKEATVVGGEIDARRNLSFINDKLQMWSIGANFTYVVSKIDRRKIITPGNDGVLGTADDISEYDERVQNARTGESVDKFRTLQGQSPYVVNAFINYKNDSLKFECNLSYNVQGKRLAVVGIARSPNVFEQPFHSLNFNASKTVGKKDRSQLTLGVSNILGDKRESFYESYQAKDRVYSRYAPSQTISLGYSYSF